MSSVKWAFEKRRGARDAVLLRIDHPIATPATLTITEDGRHASISMAVGSDRWEIDLFGPVRPSAGQVPALRESIDGTTTFRLLLDGGGGEWPRLTASRTPPPWLSVAWDMWHDDDDVEDDEDDERFAAKEEEEEEEEEDEDW